MKVRIYYFGFASSKALIFQIIQGIVLFTKHGEAVTRESFKKLLVWGLTDWMLLPLEKSSNRKEGLASLRSL